jgi:23S rRNA pseudouridine2457 synthase
VLHYYITYKPYLVLSQFSLNPSEIQQGNRKQTLKDLFDLPKDVYPVGRLDYDSEGLLILTNDSSLNHRLLHPRFAHEREYWVQVEGEITDTAIHHLQSGISITVDGKPYKTKKAIAQRFTSLPDIPPRNPPIRFRKSVPDSWLRLSLSEGKNRQVRKMTAAVGFPTLRLIRYRIGELTIDDMKPGDICEVDRTKVYAKLFSSAD